MRRSEELPQFRCDRDGFPARSGIQFLNIAAFFPVARHVFETPESFVALWNSATRVFLWTDQDNPKELQGMPWFPLARSGGKSILTNRQP